MAYAADLIRRADELGDRVNGAPQHVAEVVPELIAMLIDEKRATVLVATIYALGLAWDEEAALAVIPYAADERRSVRLAAVQSMVCGLESLPAKQSAAAVLLERCGDVDDAIRDWAVFGIGKMLDLDSPAVRAALRARLEDVDIDVQCEALVGLARRQDPSVLAALHERLQRSTVWRLEVEAAALLGNPSILSELEALASWWNVDTELLNLAIEACRDSTPVEPIEHSRRSARP